MEKQGTHNLGTWTGLQLVYGCLAAFKSQPSELFTVQGRGGEGVGGFSAVISAVL